MYSLYRSLFLLVSHSESTCAWAHAYTFLRLRETALDRPTNAPLPTGLQQGVRKLFFEEPVTCEGDMDPLEALEQCTGVRAAMAGVLTPVEKT